MFKFLGTILRENLAGSRNKIARIRPLRCLQYPRQTVFVRLHILHCYLIRYLVYILVEKRQCGKF
jgi:hypothetical protein